MPTIKSVYRCLFCEDEFKTISGAFTKCKCGKSQVEPTTYGCSYKNGSEVERISSETYYHQDEFYLMSDEIQEIYNEMKDIKERNGYMFSHFELHEKDESGNKLLSMFKFEVEGFVSSHSTELNSVFLYVHLEKKRFCGEEELKRRMLNCLNFMKQIESEEVKISDRSKLIDLSEDIGMDYRAEQLEHYDYKFYF